MTLDDKYCLGDRENLPNQFKRNYLKNDRSFLIFLLHFWNLHLILNILKKKMTLIASVFPKL